MLVVYLSVLIALALLHGLVRLRVNRLERRFTAVAAEADALLKKNGFKGGNSCRPDPYQSAKHQFELAQLAMKRDQIEERYTSWQAFSERFGRFRGWLFGYRGRILPYFGGALDVAIATLALKHVGVDVEQIRTMIGM